MFNRLPVTLILLIAMSGTGSGALAGHNKITPEIASLYGALIEATRQADGVLFEQMQEAISNLKDSSETSGNFPSQKEELSAAVGKLTLSLGENPYEPPAPPPEPSSPTIGGQSLSGMNSGWPSMNPSVGGLELGPSELASPPSIPSVPISDPLNNVDGRWSPTNPATGGVDLAPVELSSIPYTAGIGGQVIGTGEFGSRPLPLSESRRTSARQPRIQILIDAGLDDAQVEHLQGSPPKDWEGAPGSIMILSNGRDLIIAWGAGSNRKPIIDEDSGKVRLAVTRFNQN